MTTFKHLRRVLVIVMVLLAVLAVPLPAAAQEQNRISAIMSRTGYLAVLDNAIDDGAQAAVERADGLLGKKLVLIVEGTKSQPSPAVTAGKVLAPTPRARCFNSS